MQHQSMTSDETKNSTSSLLRSQLIIQQQHKLEAEGVNAEAANIIAQKSIADITASPVPDIDAYLLSKGEGTKSGGWGAVCWNIMYELAPSTILTCVVFFVGLKWFTAIHISCALLAFLILFGLPILFPPSHRRSAKSEGYDPLLLLAVESPKGDTHRHRKCKDADCNHLSVKCKDVDEAVVNGKPFPIFKHQVSLTTPHKWFARIRQLNLTPLIRIEINPDATHALLHPSSTAKEQLHEYLLQQLPPDFHHIRGSKHIIVNYLCGPRLLLRMAQWVVGSSNLRAIGPLTGRQILKLLKVNDKYNFVLAVHPLRIVLSHLGCGEVGGMYAKHALLSDLGRVVYAGEVWLDETATLHINNASGTYRPLAENLPRMREMLQQLLQISVQHHERDDKS